MDMSEMAGHSMRSVLHNRKSSAIAVISVALALGFVFGAMIAIDTIYEAIWRWSQSTSVSGDPQVAYVLSWYNPGKFEDRLFFLAMSLPAIAVGIYVSIVGANLSVSMRSEEVRSLKEKGVSNKQILSVLMMESAILGIIAAVVGLVLASIVGLSLLDTVTKFILSSESELHVTSRFFTVAGDTAMYAILSGIGLMLLVSLGPSRRLSKLGSSEAVPAAPKKPIVGLGFLLDVVLIALSLASIIDILNGMRWEGSHGFDWYTSSVDAFFRGMGLVLFPAVPLMLTVGLGRILTRSPIMLHKRFGRLLVKSAENQAPLEEDPVDRKRATRACILVALALTFGLFASVTTQATLEHEKALARYDVGSDISIDAGYYGYWDGSVWDPPLQFDHLFEVKSLAGVRNAVVIEHFVPTGVAAVVVDPDDYLDTVKPGDEFFDERGGDEMLLLNDQGSALVTERYSEYSHLVIGSRLMIHVIDYGITLAERDEWYVNVTVAGMVKDLPGMGLADLLVSHETMSVIPSYNLSLTSNGFTVIIDVDDGFDTDAVTSSALTVFQEAGLSSPYTTSLEREYEGIDADSSYGGMADLLVGEYVYVLMVALLGIGMVSFVSVVQARSRAVQSKSVPDSSRAVAGESVMLVMVGAVIGILVALTTAYLFNMGWVPVDWEPIAREVVFTGTTIAMIVASVVCLLVTPFVGALLARRAKLDLPQQPRGWL